MTTTTPTKQRSYFSSEKVNRFQLDDGESYIEHKRLDEGLYQQYQDITSRIRLDRDGESTEVDMALGRQRRFLLDNLVTNWNLVDDSGKALLFTHKKLLELPPHVIADLIKDIYKSNPILSGDEATSAEGKEA